MNSDNVDMKLSRGIKSTTMRIYVDVLAMML